MAKTKQQKEKERERRVAEKKLAETAKRRALEKASQDAPPNAAPKRTFSAGSTPKSGLVTNSKTKSYTQRRSGS